MPTATRDIQRRLRSVRNTRKITKAMELVASAKMRKASQAVMATRPYTDRAWETLLNIAKRTDPGQHPLLRYDPAPKKIAVVIITSNRGLVGAFNSQIISAVAAYIKRLQAETSVEVETILMGTKGRVIFSQHGHNIAAEFTKEDIVVNTMEIRPMAKLVINGFYSGQYDRVIVGYMDLVSSLVQKPKIRQILPLNLKDFETGNVGLIETEERRTVMSTEAAEERRFEYLFEPDPSTVLDALLPRLVEMQLYRALLETNASEHAARMTTMRNASDSASDLIDDLNLTFNQARQSGITRDLAEISASRAALE